MSERERRVHELSVSHVSDRFQSVPCPLSWPLALARQRGIAVHVNCSSASLAGWATGMWGRGRLIRGDAGPRVARVRLIRSSISPCCGTAFLAWRRAHLYVAHATIPTWGPARGPCGLAWPAAVIIIVMPARRCRHVTAQNCVLLHGSMHHSSGAFFLCYCGLGTALP